jgi:hypothetical protein
MMDSDAFFSWMTRALAAAGVALAAIVAMLLGWSITAHGASLVPDDADRHNPILCERIPDTICPPDFPDPVTMPATFVSLTRGLAARR